MIDVLFAMLTTSQKTSFTVTNVRTYSHHGIMEMYQHNFLFKYTEIKQFSYETNTLLIVVI